MAPGRPRSHTCRYSAAGLTGGDPLQAVTTDDTTALSAGENCTGTRSGHYNTGGGMDATQVGIRRIGQIAVTVRDVDRARAFYRDVLGLRHLFDAPGMAFLDCAGVRLMLAVPESGEFDHPTSILYLDVADIDASAAALEARGVKFERPAERVADLGDRVLWLASFRDSENNVLALMSEVPKEL